MYIINIENKVLPPYVIFPCHKVEHREFLFKFSNFSHLVYKYLGYN